MDNFEVLFADDFQIRLQDRRNGTLWDFMLAQDESLHTSVSREVTPMYDGSKGKPMQSDYDEAYAVAVEVARQRNMID